jgi:hypothetical protein
MVKYDMNWLKEKGFFEKIIPLKIEDKEVVVDGNNLLAYIEVSNNEEVEKIRKELSSSAQKIKYIWFYFPFEEKVKVFRRYGGELPWFWCKPELRKEFLKSREDKLNKFSVKNMDILFDTRDIAERFYWQLWEVRIKLAKSIQDLKEDGNKLLVVQHLLDRLIFFYFLAQLGLVRIKNKEIDWKLDRKRTREFFKWICEALSEKDLQDFLNKIFFDVLGEVKENGWSSEYFKIRDENFFVTAPSLNGGLFVEEEFEGKHEREIRIKGIRELILDILNNYNWVIGEEVPEEEDVIGDLTPEIIGHIYEKFVVSLEELGKQLKRINLNDIKTVKGELRAGRKKIGAYYTPPEITNYISMNTIYPCITDKINKEFKTNYKNIWDELLNKEKLTKEEVEIVKFLYFRILKELKICDNACGSGSFLIAAGDILLRLYSKVIRILEEQSEDEEVKKITLEIRKSPTRNYYIVRQIITNNLYGVDIMEGAIEIAKLRFWLWLISQIDLKWIENKKIETLPNLDFNLMIGNSLIGFVEEKIVADLPSTKRKDKLVWKNLKTRYLSLESFRYQDIIKEKEKLVDEFKLASGEKRKKLKEKIDEIDKLNREYLNKKFYELLQNKNINISWEEFLKLKPFHWSYEFPKVFSTKDPEERGFDIIIGNPPYIENKKMKNKIEKEILRVIFDSAYKLFDYSVVFIERSYQHLKNNGFFSYIITNKFIATDYGIKIRHFILKNTELRELLDVSQIGIFRGVASYPIIIIFQKHKKEGNVLLGINISNEQEISNKSFEKMFIPQEKLLKSPNFIFDLSGNFLICDVIRQKDNITLLNDLGKFYYRMLGFTNWVKILKYVNKHKTGDCLKFIGTANIKHFSVDEDVPLKVAKQTYQNCYLKYSNSFDKSVWKIFKKEKLLIKEVSLNLTTSYDPGCYANLTGMYCFIPDKKIPLFYLLGLLNSRLLDFYFRSLYGSVHMAGGYLRFNGSYLKKLPIRITNDMISSPITFLSKYLFLLSQIKNDKENDLYDDINDILNFCIYELYLREELKTNLLQLVEPYLKNIENMKSDEEKLKAIKQVAEKIRNDSKVMKEIEKIKSHKWVKVIEGVKNDSQS